MQIARHYKYYSSLLLFVLMMGFLPESAIAGRAVGVYEVSCSGCHGPASNPNNDLDRNTSASDIQDAIGRSSRTGESQMRFLQFLTPAQVDDIALQLGSPSTCPAPNVWSADGKLCQSTPTCDASKVLSVDESSCVNPIATCEFSKYFDNEANLCINSRLTVTASKPGSYDSTAIGQYTNSCSGCHGSITNPRKSGFNISKSTAAQIQGAINRNAGNNAGGYMGRLVLTPAQIDDIAAQLGTPASCALPKMWDPTSRVCTAPNTLKCTVSQIPNADGSSCISIKSDLYTTNCASCHGYGIPNKTGVNISNTSVAKIQTAIQTTSYGMGYLSTLTTQQLNDIVGILAVNCSASTFFDSTTNNCVATLPPGDYNLSCASASCHGPLASTNKPGRTATQIQAAIASTKEMLSLSTLTQNQIDDIANQLACPGTSVLNVASNSCGVAPTVSCTAPKVPDAKGTTCIDLPGDYNISCASASCHGPLASTNKPGRTATQIQAAIASTKEMLSLSVLTSSQVADIAKQLVITCSGIQVANSTGTACINPTLNCIAPKVPNAAGTACIARAVGDYELSCAGCHNSLATTTKSGKTATQIQAAINSASTGMKISSLTSLTPAQIDDIAKQLGAATTCAAPKTWDANGSICGAPPVICKLPEIRNTLTNKCVVAITKAGVVGIVGSAAAGTDVYKVTCGTGTLSLLAAIKDNTQFIRVPTISAQIIKHPHASIPAIDSVDDSKFSSLVKLNGGLGPYTVTVNKEQYIGADLLNKGLEDYTALFSCRNKTSQTATTVKLMQ